MLTLGKKGSTILTGTKITLSYRPDEWNWVQDWVKLGAGLSEIGCRTSEIGCRTSEIGCRTEWNWVQDEWKCWNLFCILLVSQHWPRRTDKSYAKKKIKIPCRDLTSRDFYILSALTHFMNISNQLYDYYNFLYFAARTCITTKHFLRV